MTDIAIQSVNLSKQYHIGGLQKQYSRLGDRVIDAIKAPFVRTGKLLRGQASGAASLDEEIWALQNVSFEIKRGEVVGIIGRNGAGKSTLLKVLSRITEPTSGYVDIFGRVGSLLEVGTGFHPELTGRENAYLNGAILGMKKVEIERKFDEIVAFAEIEKFIDTPVKHYSSGMYVRLAFSVAAHLEPEILLVDEVLAVGDVAFQKKCLGKMDDVAQEGRTVLFVSHNMSLIQSLCHRGIFVQDGTVTADDTVEKAIEAYIQSLEQVESQDLAERTDRDGQGQVRLTDVKIFDSKGETSTILTVGKPARFEFSVNKLVAGISCLFVVMNHLNQRVAIFKSDVPSPHDVYDPAIGLKFTCVLDQLLLTPGRYHVNVLIRGAGEWQDRVESAIKFDVQEGHLNERPVQFSKEVSVTMPHNWLVPLSR